MNGRLIEEYINGKIPNQRILLQELESRGYETEGKYILTIKSFGVPTTVLFLLLNDSLNKIKEFQNALDKGVDKSVKPVSQNELPTGLNLIDPKSEVASWDKLQSKSIDYSNNVSGSTVTVSSEWYLPNQNQVQKPINEVYQTNDSNIEIGRDYIKRINPATPQDGKLLINLFKEIISFFETAYGLKDRIKFEKERFSSLISTTHFPNMPQKFISICGKRGGIIHNSALDFDISPQNELKFGKDKVAQYLESGLDSVESWINDTYGKMIEELRNH